MALVLSVASAGRADSGASGFANTLHVDSDLVRSAIDTAVRHDTSLGSLAAATPMFPMAAAPKSLPPAVSGIGIGLQVGAPTALTIKFGGAQENGFVLGVGAGFDYTRSFSSSLSIHGDYLMHLATLANTGQVALTFYAGIGVWVSLFGDGYSYAYFNRYSYNAGFGLGVRVPLGLSLTVAAAPIEIYLEADPALFVFPGVGFGVGASLGFRVHF
jgi:hypothetical protein